MKMLIDESNNKTIKIWWKRKIHLRQNCPFLPCDIFYIKIGKWHKNTLRRFCSIGLLIWLSHGESREKYPIEIGKKLDNIQYIKKELLLVPPSKKTGGASSSKFNSNLYLVPKTNVPNYKNNLFIGTKVGTVTNLCTDTNDNDCNFLCLWKKRICLKIGILIHVTHIFRVKTNKNLSLMIS